MPLWLQLTASVSAALASGIMGAALVPFLLKMRFCEPQTPRNEEKETAQPKLRPTMGGILLVIGCLFGLVLSYSLYRTFCIVDGTSLSVQQDITEVLLAVCYALFWGALGFGKDLRIVRRKAIRKTAKALQIGTVFVITAVLLLLAQLTADGSGSTLLDFGFWQYDAGHLYVPLTAAVGTVLWMASAALEEETDGMGISVGGIVLLGMTVLLMQAAKTMHALLALTAAGACMGCMVWNLHPAKCRLGNVGKYWMSGIVTAVCLLSGQHTAMLLMTAVYLLNVIPSLQKKGGTLQARMREAEMKPWQQIAVLAAFAAFCGVMAAMVYQ